VLVDLAGKLLDALARLGGGHRASLASVSGAAQRPESGIRRAELPEKIAVAVEMSKV
jgi:hypothetical protein